MTEDGSASATEERQRRTAAEDGPARPDLRPARGNPDQEPGELERGREKLDRISGN